MNKVFLFSVIVPEGALRLVSLGYWRSAQYLTYRRLLVEVTPPCLYALWILICLYNYSDFSPACYNPNPSFGLFVFTVILVLVTPAAFFVLFLAAFLLIFSPCIVYQILKAYNS